MSAILFNGPQFVAEREVALRERVATLPCQPKIVSFFFQEDAAGELYTRLKQQAAARVGIAYEPHRLTVQTPVAEIVTQLQQLGDRADITGVMIQKPSRQTWSAAMSSGAEPPEFVLSDPTSFPAWWNILAAAIPQVKDVDGLHPATQAAIEDDTWQEKNLQLPATAQAVLSILEVVHAEPSMSALILGKSDLLGRPLAAVLRQRGFITELWGRGELREFQENSNLPSRQLPAQLIISATGQANLITAEMVARDAIVIDVGEPRGDVDLSVRDKAAFVTPVPGGVGPVTVLSLLENATAMVLR